MNRLYPLATFILSVGILGVTTTRADVIDMTDPNHPISLSSAPYADGEETGELPSYDCRKAHPGAETLICNDPDLAADDRQLASLYRTLPACLPHTEMMKVRDEQREWLRKRAMCSDATSRVDDAIDETSRRCLRTTFAKRIAELSEFNARCFSVSPSTAPGWSVYTDRRYGFSIAYPNTMNTSSEFIGHYHVLAGVWRQTPQDIEHPEDKGIPVLSIIVYRPNGEREYPDTEIRIGVHPGKTAAEACTWDADAPAAMHMIDGHAFRTFEIADAGMSQYVAGTSYQTFRHGYCYALESFSTGSNGVDVVEAQEKAAPLDSHVLSDVIHTFHFLDP